MKPPPVFSVVGPLAGTIAAILAMHCAQAANTLYQLSGTSGGWSTNSWSPATIGGIGAGDGACYAVTTGVAAITLDVPVTLGSLCIDTDGTMAWVINASGGNAFTLDGTGINGTNNWFGNIGVAAIGSRGAAANLTINPDVILASTDLDMGNTNSGTLTIGGNISASTAQALNFRGSGGGVITVNGSIGAGGSPIAVSNLRGSGGHVTIAGSLGGSVTCVTQNSSNSNLILSAANTSYAGAMTLTSGILQGLNSDATNVLQAFGPGGITLNGGILQLRANGTGSNQTIVTGNGTTGNNVTVGGNTTINVQRSGGANTGNTCQFNNLSIGANTLSVTNTYTYGLKFAGTTTLTGNATINPTTANITLAAINDGGGAYGITKTGSGTLTLSSSNACAGNTHVSSGALRYNSAAAVGGTGRNVLVGPNGLVIVGYAIDQAFLDRLDSASTGLVVIGVSGTTSTNLDFTNITGFLGASNTAVYTGILTPQGTTYRLGGGGGTLTLSNANAVTGAGNSLVVGGPVQSGTNIIALTDTNDIGTVTVNANTLQLSGANGALAGVTTVNLNAGSLVIDNTGAGNNHNSRINDAAVFNFGGGALTYKGYNTAGTNSTETIGNLALLAGPQSSFTVTYGSTNTAVVSTGILSRSAGLGTMLVNGNGLGRNDSATASVARLLLASAPALVGTTAAIPGGINSSVKDTVIVPFLVGEATSTSGGLGAASGTANTFVTYHTTAGLRPLNPTDEFTNNLVATGTNTRITTPTTAGSTTSINSLVIAGGDAAGNDLSIADGVTLTDASGALLFVNTNEIKPSGTSGILDFAGREGIITVNNNKTGTISATINGNSGLTKTGAGVLVLSNANNFGGGVTVNGGTLRFGNNTCLGSGRLTVNDGAVTGVSAGNPVLANAVTVNGYTTWINGGADNGMTLSGLVTLARSSTISVSQNGLSITNTISDGGSGYSLTKDGANNLYLSGTNTYTGRTIVRGGVLQGFITNAGVPGPFGAPTGDNATIDMYNGTSLCFCPGAATATSGSSDRLVNLADIGSGTVTVTPGANTNNNGTQPTIGGFMATGRGAKTLVLLNSGNLGAMYVTGGIPDSSDGSSTTVQVPFASNNSNEFHLRGVSTFSGPLTIGQNGGSIGGKFYIDGAGRLGDGAYANSIQLLGNGTSTNSATLVYNSSADQTLSGTISGAGLLTVSGNGTLTLSGSNSYGGATTVSGGKLLVNGANSGAGAVNVSASATLGGTGMIGGNTTIAVNGRLAFNLSTAAAGHDKLEITGTLVFSGASVLEITARGGSPAAGLYTLVTATGGITGRVPTLTLPSSDWVATVSKSADNKSLMLDVTTTGATAFGTWAQAKGLDGAAGRENGPTDDPDKDGRSNVAEFAFDGHPRSGANDGKVVGKIATLVSDNSRALTLTLPVRRGATFSGTTAKVAAPIDGLVYTIEGSDTLEAASWTLTVMEITGTDAAAIQAGLPGLSDINNDMTTDWTYRTFRSPGTVTDGDPRDFLRAKVTQP